MKIVSKPAHDHIFEGDSIAQAIERKLCKRRLAVRTDQDRGLDPVYLVYSIGAE